MGTITITVKGEREVEERLTALSEAIDPTMILDEASAAVFARIRERFHEEVDVEGIPWAPLKKSTIEDRIRKGYGPRPILFRTGNLFHSIQLSGSGEFERVIKTDVPYAGYLQFGTEHMASRSFLGINSGDVNLVTSIIRKRVEDALK